MAHAQTSQSYAINNGMTFSFWDDSNGPSWGQNNNGNFWVSWSNYGNNNSGDFTTGTGWAAYNGQQQPAAVGYNVGAFSMSGFGMVGVYGWFLGANYGYPDTEYYIVEMSAGSGPGGTYYGSFTSDGATYNIYHNYNPNGRGLNGNNPYGQEQWISVRQGNNSSGQNHVVHTANHFNAWKSLGWRPGAWNSTGLTVEGGFGGSGYVNGTAWASN